MDFPNSTNLDKILGLCKMVINLVSKAKESNKRCRRLSEQVQVLQKIVEGIKQMEPSLITSKVTTALSMLRRTLDTAHRLVSKCSKFNFINVWQHKSDFDDVNESLRDDFQNLTGALREVQGQMTQGMRHSYNPFHAGPSSPWSAGPPGPWSTGPTPNLSSHPPVPLSADPPVPWSASPRVPAPTGSMAGMSYQASTPQGAAAFQEWFALENDAVFMKWERFFSTY